MMVFTFVIAVVSKLQHMPRISRVWELSDWGIRVDRPKEDVAVLSSR